ncbi:MAG: MFS transporter [Halobacteriota archaeon]
MNLGVTPKEPVRTGPTLGILAFSVFLVTLTAGVVSPLLPTLQAEFGATATWTAWALTIYVAVGIVVSPIIGKLGDMYGKRSSGS